MTGPLRKRKAAASPAGNRPEKSSRGAPPLDLEAPAARTEPSGLIVDPKETMYLDVGCTLRSGRQLFVPCTHNPGPMPLQESEKPVYSKSWLTAGCAKIALQYYNRLNEGEHELVKAVDSSTFFFDGPYMHANFLAKPKGTMGCPDLDPKCFFAELKICPRGKYRMSCLSCIEMDPANPKTAPVNGCRLCPSEILHPAAGGHRGARKGGHRGARKGGRGPAGGHRGAGK